VLALDGTTVLVAVIGFPATLLVAVAALVSAVGTVRNGRAVRRNSDAVRLAIGGVSRVEAELRPNGGTSAYDRLAGRLDHMDERWSHRMDRHDDDIQDLKLAIGDVAGHVADLTREAMAEKQWRQEHEAEIAVERRSRTP